MTELSMPATEAASINLGTFALAPAPADTITFNIEGNISGNVALIPGNISFLGSGRSFIEQSLGLEPGTIPETVNFNEDFTDNFTVLNDPAQFEGGDITLDLPFLSSSFGFTPTTPIEEVLDSFDIEIPAPVQQVLDVLQITNAEDAVGALNDLFNFELDGTGTFTSGTQSTNFDIEYFNDTNSIVIDDFDPDVVSLGLEGESTIAAEGTFSVDLVLSEFIELTDSIGLDIPSNLAVGINLLQLSGVNELTLATGSFDLESSTVPVFDPLSSFTASVL